MTAIFYPDCNATSANGRFTLEARSPHNGTINHRDGRKVSEDEFGFKYREHQSEFRYQLLDNTRGRPLSRLFGGEKRRIVWERWQGREEDSPGELIVSDDGWAVIRTHGFHPETIAVAPDGRDAVRVRVTSVDDAPSEPSETPVWPLERLACSTAGHYWAGCSLRFFFEHKDNPHFVWRTSWGQRLVMDLGRGIAFADESHLSAELAAAVLEAEKQQVIQLLSNLSRRMDDVRSLLIHQNDEDDGENPLWPRIRQAAPALNLVGAHQIRECVPFLREWENIDLPAFSTGSTALSNSWWLEAQYYRPIVHHSLKRLGEEPRGFATYHFTRTTDETKTRFPMPEHISDRRQRAGRVSKEMPAEEVLRLLGAPDFIRRRSKQVGEKYVWPEDWEYDFRAGATWVTLRLTWEERGRLGHLTNIEEVAPYWLETDERQAEFLRM